MPDKRIPIYIVMGVSASGKTTLGKALADNLSIPFLDGDAFHPTENIAKMSAGVPLTDSDREIWLNRLHNLANDHLQNGCVIACSALKEKYRKILSHGISERIHWIVLYGDYEVIQTRIQNRSNHFMPPGLLKSQFEALELPDYGTHLDVSLSTKQMLQQIVGLAGNG